MKHSMRSIFAVVAIALTTAVFAANITFGQVVDGVDPRKNTKLAAKEYWKSVKGQEVTWNGEVFDVKGGSSKAKVYVADKSRPLYKGYNIIVETIDVPKAASLKKGQKIRFKGLLDGYDQKDNGAIVELNEASLL
jgi:hypothetical protein